MRALWFPFAFLIFLVPLPDELVYWLETASKLASADAANLFFNISGTPLVRDGTVFQLPGIVIEVAQECSGIRSSLVLFITSLLVAHLFLKSPWRRIALVAFVIPLGILRNGFRILVIGLLCVHYGPADDPQRHSQKGRALLLHAVADPALFVPLVVASRRNEGLWRKEAAVGLISPAPRNKGQRGNCLTIVSL